MSLYGADVEQLERLAKDLGGVADLLRGSGSTISATLQALTWMGPGADRFRSEWADHAGRLKAAESSLSQLATIVRKQAEQQRSASGDVSGTGSGDAGPGALAGAPGVATGGFVEGGPALAPLDFGQASGAGALSGGGLPGGAAGGALGPLGGTTGLQAAASGGSVASNIFKGQLGSQLNSILSGNASLSDLKPSAAGLLNALGTHQVAGSTSIDWSTGWSVHDAGSGSWGSYDVTADAGVGFEAEASGYAGLRDGQLQAGFQAGAQLGAHAGVAGQADLLGFVPMGVQGEVLVGAEASAAGAVTVGSEGLTGDVGAEAFAGARAGGRGSLGLGDSASGALGGEVWAGAGVKFDVDLSLSMDKVGADFDVGAAFGFGGHVKFGLGFSPTGVVDDVGDVVGGAASVLEGVGDGASSAVSSVASTITGWL